jgi:hypothetical protein
MCGMIQDGDGKNVGNTRDTWYWITRMPGFNPTNIIYPNITPRVQFSLSKNEQQASCESAQLNTVWLYPAGPMW